MRILACLLLCWLTSLGAAEDRALSAAETAYAKGDYATAVEQWSEEALKEGVTAGRLSALGNAEWRLGRKGRAMVCWERALLLDPFDPVALAGIRHALDAGGTERPAFTWTENYAAFLTADVWLILATGTRVGELLGAAWADSAASAAELRAAVERSGSKLGFVDLDRCLGVGRSQWVCAWVDRCQCARHAHVVFGSVDVVE